jgi:hypothetical protein
MPTAEVLQKFKTLLSGSKTFALLESSRQAEYLNEFEKATDEQIIEAMKTIEEEDKNQILEEQRQLNLAKKQLEMSEMLQQKVREAELTARKSQEKADQVNSQQALKSMEEELNKKEAQPLQKKKFLGLF